MPGQALGKPPSQKYGSTPLFNSNIIKSRCDTMKRANGVGHLEKSAGSGAGSGGFRGFVFKPKSRLAVAPLHFTAGSAAGSGGFRGIWVGVNRSKQTHGVRHLDQNQRAPKRNSAGSGGVGPEGRDRLWRASSGGFWRVPPRAPAEQGSRASKACKW